MRAGAVLQAVVQQGEGDATPKDGDLVSRQQAGPAPQPTTDPQQKNSQTADPAASFVQVYVHYSVLNAENDLLYTTWAEEGGNQPLAFVLGKGSRAPRAWELSLLGEGCWGTNQHRQSWRDCFSIPVGSMCSSNSRHPAQPLQNSPHHSQAQR